MNPRIFLLITGVTAASSAVIFLKLSTVDSILLSSYRCLVAAAVLSPLFLRDWKRHRVLYTRRHLLRCLIPATILSVHFITWIIGARHTDSANATLIVNFVPVVMPFILYLMMGERINRTELAGTAVATIGVCFLGLMDYRFRPEFFYGDALCFLSMFLFAAYLALGRRNGDFPTLWLYVIPVYFFSGIVSLAIAAFAGVFPAPVAPVEWLWIFCLGFIPTVLGHSIMNYSLKHMRGQLVVLINLFQFITAAVMAYWILAEVPTSAFYPASILIVIGAIIVIRHAPPGSMAPAPESGGRAGEKMPRAQP